MSNLAILRQKLQEKAANETRVSGDGSANYAFWNIPEGSTAIVRFLPDADTTNPFFWAQKDTISLSFDGILGGDPKPLTIKVPSMSPWQEDCPITEAIRPLWQSDRETAKRYYRKKSFNYAAFVVNSPLVEERVPANPIRRLALNQSIHDVIWAAIMDPEMEDVPTDFTNGRDFKIVKTRKGDYANYSTSSFSMKTRALSEDEHAAIKQYGLPKFADYLGRKPDAKELDAIFSMFQDSLAGKPYDLEKYGEYFKPWTPSGAANQNGLAGATATPTGGHAVDHLSTLEMIRSIKR